MSDQEYARIQLPANFSVIESILDRLAQLEKPSGESIRSLTAMVREALVSVDAKVVAAITANSYTRAEVDGLVGPLATLLTLLPPARGGTGTTNAHDNEFTVGSWRAAWIRSDGTIGTVPSTGTVKSDIATWHPPIETLRAIDTVTFRYNAEVDLLGDRAAPRLGVIAEQLHELELNPLVVYERNGTIAGADYSLIGVAGLHLAQATADEVDQLRRELANTNNRVTELEARLTALENQ